MKSITYLLALLPLLTTTTIAGPTILPPPTSPQGEQWTLDYITYGENGQILESHVFDAYNGAPVGVMMLVRTLDFGLNIPNHRPQTSKKKKKDEGKDIFFSCGIKTRYMDWETYDGRTGEILWKKCKSLDKRGKGMEIEFTLGQPLDMKWGRRVLLMVRKVERDATSRKVTVLEGQRIFVHDIDKVDPPKGNFTMLPCTVNKDNQAHCSLSSFEQREPVVFDMKPPA